MSTLAEFWVLCLQAEYNCNLLDCLSYNQYTVFTCNWANVLKQKLHCVSLHYVVTFMQMCTSSCGSSYCICTLCESLWTYYFILTEILSYRAINVIVGFSSLALPLPNSCDCNISFLVVCFYNVIRDKCESMNFNDNTLYMVYCFSLNDLNVKYTLNKSKPVKRSKSFTCWLWIGKVEDDGWI